MTATNDFDRLVASWLETSGPASMGDDLVASALATARRVPQRGGLRTFAMGPADWPRRRATLWALPPMIRFVGLVALVVVVLVASAVVGGRLLDATPVLPAPSGLPAVAPSAQASAAASPIPSGALPSASTDPLAHGRFAPAPDLAVARAGAIVVWIHRDGRVLVVGGDASGASTGELFNPETTTSFRVDLPAAITSAVDLPDGRVLMVGDSEIDPTRPGASALFDPVTMTVERTAPQRIPRAGAQLARLPDGRVLMVGGTPPHADGDEVGAVQEAEVFDPSTDTWSSTGSLHTNRISGHLATLSDGRVLVLTGSVPNGLPINVAGGGVAAETYDPATGRWTRVFALDPGTPHVELGPAIGLPDGRVAFAAPRLPAEGNNGPASSRLEIWDSRTNAFTEPVELPGDVTSQVAMHDGRIFLVGVVDAHTTWSGIFDPTSDDLIATGPTRAWGPSSVLLGDGRVLVVGGRTDGDFHVADGPDHRIPPAVSTMESFG
jgi:hypothetical protein